MCCPFRRPIEIVSDICLRVGVVIGVFRKYAAENRLFMGDGVVSPPMTPIASASMIINMRVFVFLLMTRRFLSDRDNSPATDTATKRRRQLAMKAIDDQIAKKKQQKFEPAAPREAANEEVAATV